MNIIKRASMYNALHGYW